MPRTTSSDRGSIVLVRFVFADEKGAKRRPVEARRGRAQAGSTSKAVRSRPTRSKVEDELAELWGEACGVDIDET